MITRFSLSNFKAHAHTDVALRPFTVLVGANGVGKTSMLEGLHILAQCLRTPTVELLRGQWEPRHLVRIPDVAIVLSEVFRGSGGDENTIRLEVELDPLLLTFTSKGKVSLVGNDFDSSGFFGQTKPKHPLLREASSAVMLRPSARAIARVGHIAPDGARVEHDGANTAAVIAHWKLADDERLQQVTQALQKVVPQVRALRAKPVALEDDRDGAGFALFVDFDDAKDVPAELVSEGTLVALSLLVLLHSAPQPRLVLIDDLGAQLHPSAQGELVSLLREIQLQNPLLQIVASTHSPYVLDAVEPADVLVFARGKDGAARVRPLAEHPNANIEGITTGQLWTMDPESWVLEGEP